MAVSLTWPRRPRDLRDRIPRAGRILLRNVYGWFERTEHGVLPSHPTRRSGGLSLGRWSTIG